jgi:hypothetical protein
VLLPDGDIATVCVPLVVVPEAVLAVVPVEAVG